MSDETSEEGRASDLDLSAMLARARTGDRDALGALWVAHNHLVLRFLRGVGVRSADDVASNVWIDVAKGLARFEGNPTDFRRWMFTIARRRAIDESRWFARRTEDLAADAGDHLVSPDTADCYEQQTAIDRALAMIGALPTDQAEVILLRIIADLDVGEVAAIVGKSEGNVRVIMHRGLQRLAERSVVTRIASRTIKNVP